MTAPDTPIALHSVSTSQFETASDLLVLARQLLSKAAPALAEEIPILVTEVIFAADVTGAGSEFGGATSFQAWGALFLNGVRHTSLVSMVDGLVHEAAHALLFALSAGERLVENHGDNRYDFPLRADPRPMEGIFHATFVSARVHYAMDRLLAQGGLEASQRMEAESTRDRTRRAFQQGNDIVRAHARPTAIGRQAMEGAEAYMA